MTNESTPAASAPRDLTDLLGDRMTIAMLMTMVGQEHTSRPVTCADVTDRRLSFLVSSSSEWVKAIAAGIARVHVTAAHESHSIYLSLNGTAQVVHDDELNKHLWSPQAKLWFTGPDDPDLCVVHFDVADGQYWDGPDTGLGRMIAFTRAIFGDDPEVSGTHGEIRHG